MKQAKFSPKQVRHIRTKVLRLSLQKMANAVGVSKASIVNWEQGKTTMLPAFETAVQKLASKASTLKAGNSNKKGEQ